MTTLDRSIKAARDSYRSQTFRGADFGEMSISYNQGTSGRHIIQHGGFDDKATCYFATIEEARAKWAAVVAGWKAEDHVLVRTRKGRDSREVWVR